jgi:hypothetical protein
MQKGAPLAPPGTSGAARKDERARRRISALRAPRRVPTTSPTERLVQAGAPRAAAPARGAGARILHVAETALPVAAWACGPPGC